MDTYITTKTHPELKEGVIFYYDKDTDTYDSQLEWSCANQGEIDYAVKQGYMKELQEPIWTDDDMMSFKMYVPRNHMSLSPEMELVQWKKEKGK